MTFRALQAEALMALGRADEAIGPIAAAARLAGGASLATLTDVARVQGRAAALERRAADAARYFDRALRLVDATGNVCTRRELLAQYEAACPDAAPRADALHPQAQPAAAQVGGGFLLESAALLAELAGHPALLGREAFTLLLDAGCVTHAALLARSADAPPEVLAHAGWTAAEALAQPAASAAGVPLRLGAWQQREIELHLTPAPGLAAATAAVAIQRLLQSALALEALRRDEKQRAALWPVEPLAGDGDEIHLSRPMVEHLTIARRIAPTDIAVLITGETGTGKELMARAVHRASRRANRPFVPFNCAAVPREMLESQLFGYRRGAFTGAHESFQGIIRAAAGGTLFLDEIGEMSAELQPKLLRFLETGEIHPLGEAQPVRTDVRVIAATNADLDRIVAEGRFREDLYYRLNVIRFRLPPLRERREEIPALAQHFLERHARELRKGTLRIAEDAMEYLLLYAWPGNIRQLANEMQRVAAVAEPDSSIMPGDLSADIRASRRTIPAGPAAAAPDEIVVRADQPLPQAIETIERVMLRRALERTDGRVEAAARLLGISRKGLFLKRRRWNIDPAGRHAS